VTGLLGVVTSTGDGGPASLATVSMPYLAVGDLQGNIYVVESSGSRVRRIDAATQIIETYAGNGFIQYVGDGGAAVSSVVAPRGQAIDGTTLYFSSGNVVRKIDLETGVITTYAGSSAGGFAGDGGPATAAQLSNTQGLAVDGQGNLFIAESVNARIRRVDAITKTITTYAGSGIQGFSGDGGLAVDARLRGATDITFDPDGNLIIGDSANGRIRRVDSAGIITTIAGGGTSGDGSLATSASVGTVSGPVYDGAGNLYFADASRIRRIDATTKIITSFAGSNGGFGGDDGLATAALLSSPEALAIGGGRLFVADSNNNRIRSIDLATNIITTIAGSGPEGGLSGTFDGDGNLALTAGLRRPVCLSVDASGDVIFGEETHLRRVDATTTMIRTVAGAVAPERMGPLAQALLADPQAIAITDDLLVVAGGDSGTVQVLRRTAGTIEAVIGRYPQPTSAGNRARFRDATFGRIAGVAIDPAAGVIYLAETAAHRIHAVTMVDPADADTWTIQTIANPSSTRGFLDGDATLAQFREPSGLWLDSTARLLYIADTGNHAIRILDLATMMVSTFAGTPQTLGFSGDGGPQTAALMYQPQALTHCANGDWFIADTGNHRVRRIHQGQITTVLGTGLAGSSGQGTPARTFPVDTPLGLTCDATGNLFVTSRSTVRLLPADATGVVDGSGVVLTIYGLPPRDTFPASLTRCLTGIVPVDATTLHVADACTGMVIELGFHRI